MATQIATLRQESNVQPAKPQARSILDYLATTRVEKGIAAVAGKYFTADRFLRLAVNTVKKTPLLLKCDPQSVLGCFMTSAALALEPNTIQQQAFLIPYKRRAKVEGEWKDIYEAQFQVGSRGFVTLAHRSPYIKSIEAEAIHEGDLFEHMKGSDAFLKYRKALKDRGPLIGSWCLTKLESGIEIATVLPLDEIHKIRSKSETYNSLLDKLDAAENDKDRLYAERKLAETPWVMWEDDMATKSAIKKHSKQMPLVPEDTMSAAAEIDSRADMRTIDMAAMADPDVVRSVVQDGYEPPSLENNASETVSYNFPAADREAETIRQDQTHGSGTQRRSSSAQTAPTADSVAAAMRSAKTVDDLDLAADAGRDISDAAARDTLDGIYKQRHAELSGDGSDADQGIHPARRRGPLNVE